MVHQKFATPLIFLLLFGLFSCKAPRPENLGVATSGKLQPCPSSPNCVSSFSEDEEHGMEPMSFEEKPQVAWDRMKSVVEGLRRTEVVKDSGDYLHVEFKTKFGFIDDVEFLLDKDEKKIHFRSASRVGYSDLGQNRMRMKKIIKKFNEVVQ